MSLAAHAAQEDGNIPRACQLYVDVMNCSEASDKSELTTDYSSQLADLLMNIHFSNPVAPGVLASIADISELLAGAIGTLCTSMSKVCHCFKVLNSNTQN